MTQGTGLIVVSLLVLCAVLFGIHRFLKANQNSAVHQSKGWVYAVVLFLGLGIIFALLPIESSAKNSVFSLLGLVVTAVIAISSTTFASNAMAGIMLRIIRNFKIGDFIEVENHFGRVSEIGLLHTEIQTKSRDLTTLPNMFLVTNAVTVVPQDKALADATLSLGYDVSHHEVEHILKSAANKIGLADAFVHVTDLGDFSIGYRVAGFLDNPKLLLSARSNLRKQIIDSLHGAGIEIVSPTFMNQRQYGADETFISEVKKYQERQNRRAEQSTVFDKAEAAEEIEQLKAELNSVNEQLKQATEAEQPLMAEKKQQLYRRLSELELRFGDKQTISESLLLGSEQSKSLLAEGADLRQQIIERLAGVGVSLPKVTFIKQHSDSRAANGEQSTGVFNSTELSQTIEQLKITLGTVTSQREKSSEQEKQEVRQQQQVLENCIAELALILADKTSVESSDNVGVGKNEKNS